MTEPSPQSARERVLPPSFVARTLFVLAAAAAFVLASKLSSLFLLLFGAVVVAVILRSIADPLTRWTPIKGAWSVLAAVLVVVGVVAGISYLYGRQVAEQANALSQQVPRAWDVLQGRLSASPIGAQVLEQLKSAVGQADKVFALAPKFALGFASGVTTLVLVLVAGVYLAMRPTQSRDGVLTLAPKAQRERLRYVMDCTGRALKGWFKAQLVSMVLVGSLVGLGLWPLGVPSPLALGLFAGVAQFVPVVGPIVSALPALILAATNGPEQAGADAACCSCASHSWSRTSSRPWCRRTWPRCLWCSASSRWWASAASWARWASCSPPPWR